MALPDESYPPLFRHNTAVCGVHPAPPGPPTVSHPTADLPVVDLHDLDPRALAAACREWGVFRLTNHGVPPSLLGRLHGEARRFLSLPFEAKRARFASPAATYFFGTPAVTLCVRNLNWVEGLHVPLGRPPPADPDPDDFRGLVEEYGRHSARVVKALFQALAAELGLDAERSASYLSDADGMLRLLRYPRCPDATRFFGMDAHTDSSVLTTVSQGDQAGGLQVLRGQTWCHVKPVAGTLVVNVGDMLQAMSDDEYRSMEHRVLASGAKERLSICYFAFPREDGVIASSRYREFTYGDFKQKVQEDIRAVGFKLGLERFRVPAEPH